MKNGLNKEDHLVSEIMKDFKMESPSDGFTDRVMQNIQLEPDIPAVSSRPLISNAGWIGIAVSLFVLILFVFFGTGNEVPAETGSLMQRLPSIQLPSVEFHFNSLFSWINLNSPTLFWIFTGIGGMILLGFLERLINGIRIRNFFNL